MATVKTSETSAFVDNVNRANSLSQLKTVLKCTANRPIDLGTEKGVHLFKVEMVVGLDTAFPTKKGGVTSALVMIPLDGAKKLVGEWGSIEFNAGNPFIYKASRMFTVLDKNGDVAKKGRVSASDKIEAMQALMEKQRMEFERKLEEQRQESAANMAKILEALNKK